MFRTLFDFQVSERYAQLGAGVARRTRQDERQRTGAADGVGERHADLDVDRRRVVMDCFQRRRLVCGACGDRVPGTLHMLDAREVLHESRCFMRSRGAGCGRGHHGYRHECHAMFVHHRLQLGRNLTDTPRSPDE